MGITDDGWFEVNHHSTRNVLSSSSLAEESVEGVITSSDSFVRRHLPVWLDSMLEAIQLPTSISDLGPGLANMDGDTLTLEIK